MKLYKIRTSSKEGGATKVDLTTKERKHGSGHDKRDTHKPSKKPTARVEHRAQRPGQSKQRVQQQQNRTHKSGHDKKETQKPTQNPTTQVKHRAHRRAKQIERVQQQQRANGPINCPCGSYLVDFFQTSHSFTPGGSIFKRGATYIILDRNSQQPPQPTSEPISLWFQREKIRLDKRSLSIFLSIVNFILEQSFAAFIYIEASWQL